MPTLEMPALSRACGVLCGLGPSAVKMSPPAATSTDDKGGALFG